MDYYDPSKLTLFLLHPNPVPLYIVHPFILFYILQRCLSEIRYIL